MDNSRMESSVNGQTSESMSKARPKKVLFTQEEEELIINHYQQHEFLWNPKHDNYKFGWKTSCVKDLAIAMGNKFTPSDIHARFSAMRSTYRANANKVRASSTGSQAIDVYVPTWQHYESLKFLDATQPSRISATSYTVQRDENVCSELEYLNDSEEIVKDFVPPRTQDGAPSKTGKTSKKRKTDDEVLDECLGILRTVNSSNGSNGENTSSVDRHQHFGNYVASCLREMLPSNVSYAFAEISNVLLKYDKNFHDD